MGLPAVVVAGEDLVLLAFNLRQNLRQSPREIAVGVGEERIAVEPPVGGVPVPRGATVVVDAAQLGADFAADLPPAVVEAGPPATAPISLRDATLAFQRDRIRRALVAHGGNWAAAARALGMHRSNLHHLANRPRPALTARRRIGPARRRLPDEQSPPPKVVGTRFGTALPVSCRFALSAAGSYSQSQS